MSDSFKLKGLVNGMKSMGAAFIKTDGFYAYFEIKKGGLMDDDVKLKRAKLAFTKLVGLGLKIKRVK